MQWRLLPEDSLSQDKELKNAHFNVQELFEHSKPRLLQMTRHSINAETVW